MAFTQIGELPLEVIDALIEQIPDWNTWGDTGRETIYQVHKHTKTLPLRIHDGDARSICCAAMRFGHPLSLFISVGHPVSLSKFNL